MSKKDTEQTTVAARVLTDCIFGRANDVVQLSQADAAQAVAAGQADTTAEAVTYALSLPAAAGA